MKIEGPVAVLLRGVNVGGHKMEMARLRRKLAEAGFADARTYLQSGNAVISVGQPTDRLELGAMLEAAIATEFGFACTVVLRDSAQLAACAAADPFLHLVDRPAHHLIGFCSEAPDPAPGRLDSNRDYGPDQIKLVGDHVYMWCPGGFSRSPFFKMKLDRLLGVDVTIRNWNTVLKLTEMINGIPQ